MSNLSVSSKYTLKAYSNVLTQVTRFSKPTLNKFRSLCVVMWYILFYRLVTMKIITLTTTIMPKFFIFYMHHVSYIKMQLKGFMDTGYYTKKKKKEYFQILDFVNILFANIPTYT